MALKVYGIIMQDGQGGPPKLPAGVQVHALRELAAVAEEGEYSARETTTADADRHLEIVSALFAEDAVLPTPVGTVFRSAEVLQRWMELHYVALSDALAWVEHRVAARVHVTRARGNGANRDVDPDIAAIAAEVARSLRRSAVASVPLHADDESVTALSAAFLVEQELWNEFAEAIAEEQDRHPLLHIALTGPWPPYDFVRLQFGA